MTGLLVRYLRPYSRQLLLVVVLLTAQAIANLYLPNLNADIINNGVVVGNIGYIESTGLVMLLVTLLLVGFSVVAVYWGSRIAMAFGRDVRSAIFRRVMEFSQAETNRFGTASLITRNTNDVQQVQQVLVVALNIMIAAPILAVGGVIMAVREDATLSLLLIVIIPIMAGVIGLLLSRAIPLFRSMQVKIDRVNQVTRESLSGVRVIRAFVRTEHEEIRFDDANRDLTVTALRVYRLFALLMPMLMVILNLSTVAIIWFGSQRVAAGQMPIGNLTAFLLYVAQILMSVLLAVFLFVLVPRAAASAERIQEVLLTPATIHDPAEPADMSGALGNVEFHDVEFRYPGAEEPILHGISLIAAPGRTTAIVGSTGAGKSTLINLIPRLYDVTAGSITIDGIDVRRVRQEDLWHLIGVVPQRAYLFSGTVATNLRYGNPTATDEELWHALGIALGREFVAAMPGGLDAPIDQGGTNLSGGQRQRIAIARALVKRPRIYVFDDSFSALDFKTDALLRVALRAETRTASVFIVAQRVGTIMHADQIVVLDFGRIVGIGTHVALMETCETYREIVSSQLTAEEAA